jgi:hypothetical protein
MAVIKNTNSTNVDEEGGWGEGTTMHYWWKCKLVQPLGKAVWRFLKN